MSLLTINSLFKAYNDKRVLAIRELSLAPGEIVLLQGENGSGKTTLLRILAGLESPDNCAHFSFFGKPQATAPDVAYVHQSPYLFSGSVRDNIEYGLRRCRLPLQQANEAIRWAGIEDIADVPVSTLSGGGRRRVALARVRALRPRVYLLDEPLAHLDADGEARVRALLAGLRDENATAIIASHTALPATTRWYLSSGRDRQLTITMIKPDGE